MRYLLFLLLFTICSVGYAQDVIVTLEHDTIQCKINTILEDNIYYTIRTERSITHANIPLVDVLVYTRNNVEIKASEVKKPIVVENKEQPTPPEVVKEKRVETVDVKNAVKSLFEPYKFRVSLGVGYGVRAILVPDTLPDFLKKFYQTLHQGMVISGDVSFFFSKKSGVGAFYSQINSSALIEDVYFVDSAGMVSDLMTVKETVKIQIFMPMYYFRLTSRNDRNIYLFKGGLGISTWEDRLDVGKDYFVMKGTSSNLTIGAEYNYRVDPRFFVGAYLGIDSSIMLSYEVYDGSRTYIENNAPEDISKFNIGLVAGLTF